MKPPNILIILAASALMSLGFASAQDRYGDYSRPPVCSAPPGARTCGTKPPRVSKLKQWIHTMRQRKPSFLRPPLPHFLRIKEVQNFEPCGQTSCQANQPAPYTPEPDVYRMQQSRGK